MSAGAASNPQIVNVDIVPVLDSLEGIASMYTEIEESGVSADILGHKVPRNYPTDFIEAARVAVERLEQEPALHDYFDPGKARQGYELLKNGTVQVWYVLPERKSF